ncbi:MAG: cytochrome c [Oceanospirillales bacterium]|nr:cytochrome c [Oceanospirillales bacterium]
MTAAVGGVLLVSALSVQAAEVDDAIEYRQGIFNAFKWNLGPMGAMIKGKMPYDQAQFTLHAQRLETLSHMPLEGFVEGSDSGDTDAKAEIWSDMDTFSAGFDKLQTNAAALVEASNTGDMEQIKPAFGAVAKSCKGCHDNFRKD